MDLLRNLQQITSAKQRADAAIAEPIINDPALFEQVKGMLLVAAEKGESCLFIPVNGHTFPNVPADLRIKAARIIGEKLKKEGLAVEVSARLHSLIFVNWRKE